MKIVAIRDCTIKLEANISNALVSFSDHTVSLVAIISDQFRDGKPVIGFGFNSIGRYGQSGILRERLIPRLLAANSEDLLGDNGASLDPAAIARVCMENEKPGGHGDRSGAIAALELAAWDLNAKLADEPAYHTIRKYFGVNTGSDYAETYAAGGYYYPEDSLSRLLDELKAYQEQGYHSVKIKVGGAALKEDIERIEKSIAVIGASTGVAVDANGRFDRSSAETFAAEINRMNLSWFEEPGDPLDFELNRHLAEQYPNAIATGENLFSVNDCRNLIRYGGMRSGLDVFQMDPGLSYGLTEYATMLSELEASGYQRQQCYPHGGHLINLHVVVGLGLGGCESYPNVFQPFGGYSAQTRLEEGRLYPSDAPGFGLEQKETLYPALQLLADLNRSCLI